MKPQQFNAHPIDAAAYPQAAKFMDRYATLKSSGLVDIKFFAGDVQGATLESFFAEVNCAIDAETVADAEIF